LGAKETTELLSEGSAGQVNRGKQGRFLPLYVIKFIRYSYPQIAKSCPPSFQRTFLLNLQRRAANLFQGNTIFCNNFFDKGVVPHSRFFTCSFASDSIFSMLFYHIKTNDKPRISSTSRASLRCPRARNR